MTGKTNDLGSSKPEANKASDKASDKVDDSDSLAEARKGASEGGSAPDNFGQPVPPELAVLSAREQELVAGGHSISGAQQTVTEEGGEATDVLEALTEAADE